MEYYDNYIMTFKQFEIANRLAKHYGNLWGCLKTVRPGMNVQEIERAMNQFVWKGEGELRFPMRPDAPYGEAHVIGSSEDGRLSWEVSINGGVRAFFRPSQGSEPDICVSIAANQEGEPRAQISASVNSSEDGAYAVRRFLKAAQVEFPERVSIFDGSRFIGDQPYWNWAESNWG